MVKKVLLAFFTFTLFWSCSKLSPKIAAPAYLEIDGYKVITDSQTQGTNYQKFTDVLITSSTTNYGYYPIPGKIPLPFNGNNYLIIRPVIEVNGVSALRVDYPLMKGCDTVLPLNGGGQLNKFRPTFKYFPNVNFRFKEDFEAASTSMVNSNSADTFGVKTDFSQHFNGGQKCLLMQLDANHTSCQAQSSYAFHLPNDGTSIYLEINYKCNTNFEVGLIGTNSPNGPNTEERTIGGANASSAWNKIYFSLSDITRTPTLYGYYYLYFYKGAYDPSSTTNLIYIDNIKVISQE